MNEHNVQRVNREQLLKLNKDGRPCEVCGFHMYDHEWVDLDYNGFVVNCALLMRTQ